MLYITSLIYTDSHSKENSAQRLRRFPGPRPVKRVVSVNPCTSFASDSPELLLGPYAGAFVGICTVLKTFMMSSAWKRGPEKQYKQDDLGEFAETYHQTSQASADSPRTKQQPLAAPIDPFPGQQEPSAWAVALPSLAAIDPYGYCARLHVGVAKMVLFALRAVPPYDHQPSGRRGRPDRCGIEPLVFWEIVAVTLDANV